MSKKKLKPKTDEEVKVEVAALKKIKPRVRRYTAFGDDNWHRIDVQIEVLEGNLAEDDLDRYTNSDDNSIAYDTIQWREGKPVDEAPAEGWKPLTRKR